MTRPGWYKLILKMVGIARPPGKHTTGPKAQGSIMSMTADAALAAAVPFPFPHLPVPRLPAGTPPEAGRIEVPLGGVTFRELHTPHQVRQILHLREEIHLAAAVREAPAFVQLEKKETSRGWWAPSSATAG